MAACQQFNWNPGGTATHTLEGLSWQCVSNSIGAKKAHGNSLTGRNFMEACQQIQLEPRRHTATHSLEGDS